MSSSISDLTKTRQIFKQLLTRFDADYGAFWYYMDPRPRPCFNSGFLGEFASCQRIVDRINRSSFEQGRDCPVQYTVLASRFPGVYSMGGDLELFKRLILER